MTASSPPSTADTSSLSGEAGVRRRQSGWKTEQAEKVERVGGGVA